MLNVIAIQGRMVNTPELKTTANGTSVAVFTVASDRDYVPAGEERQADFLDVVAWGKTAEFVSKWFAKGNLIALTGRLQTRNYEDKNGNKRKAVEILANTVNFCGPKNNDNSPQSQPSSTYIEIDVDDDCLPF